VTKSPGGRRLDRISDISKFKCTLNQVATHEHPAVYIGVNNEASQTCDAM